MGGKPRRSPEKRWRRNNETAESEMENAETPYGSRIQGALSRYSTTEARRKIKSNGTDTHVGCTAGFSAAQLTQNRAVTVEAA